MKNSVIKAALVAGTLCITVNAHAQEVSKVTGGNQPSTSKDAKAANHTVLNGNWSVLINPEGKLCIYDKDDNIVRVIEGGLAAYNENGTIFNSAATYPFMLSVDKIGNLHIIDLTGIAAADKTNNRLLSLENSSFSDPDLPGISGANDAQYASLTPKKRGN